MSTTVSRELRREVLEANLRIPEAGLATLTWGNVSGVDRRAGVFVIKPSGVAYDALSEDDLVVVSLSDGSVVEGRLRPSTDTETHRSLYLAFPSIGGVTHTHSTHAVAFAQARRPIPVLGTTHADTFNGPVPVTAPLTPEQCAADYEYHTGQVIVDLLEGDDTRAREVPGALVAHHGPFTWGPTPPAPLSTPSSARRWPRWPCTPSPSAGWNRRSTSWTATSPASTVRAPTTATRPPPDRTGPAVACAGRDAALRRHPEDDAPPAAPHPPLRVSRRVRVPGAVREPDPPGSPRPPRRQVRVQRWLPPFQQE